MKFVTHYAMLGTHLKQTRFVLIKHLKVKSISTAVVTNPSIFETFPVALKNNRKNKYMVAQGERDRRPV